MTYDCILSVTVYTSTRQPSYVKCLLILCNLSDFIRSSQLFFVSIFSTGSCSREDKFVNVGLYSQQLKVDSAYHYARAINGSIKKHK